MRRRLFLFICGLILIGCSGIDVKSEQELRNIPPKLILELAAERYINYDYKAANYYYQQLIDLYPQETNYVLWAYYEQGYIYYKQNKLKNAVENFNKILQMETSRIMPAQILAGKMKTKIINENKTLFGIKNETKKKPEDPKNNILVYQIGTNTNNLIRIYVSDSHPLDDMTGQPVITSEMTNLIKQKAEALSITIEDWEDVKLKEILKIVSNQTL